MSTRRGSSGHSLSFVRSFQHRVLLYFHRMQTKISVRRTRTWPVSSVNLSKKATLRYVKWASATRCKWTLTIPSWKFRHRDSRSLLQRLAQLYLRSAIVSTLIPSSLKRLRALTRSVKLRSKTLTNKILGLLRQVLSEYTYLSWCTDSKVIIMTCDFSKIKYHSSTQMQWFCSPRAMRTKQRET